MDERDVRQMIKAERQRLADKLLEFSLPGHATVLTAQLINDEGDYER